MNYALLLACVVGAGAVTGYATAAVFAARRAEGLERLPGRQAFLLRALPGASALLVSLGLALPSFLRHEPLDTRAWPGLTALLLGLAALLLLRDALKRGLPSWWATRRLRHEWGQHSAPLPLEGAPVASFALHHPFPVVAVVGVLRPRLFLATQVLDVLTPGEVRAVLAHEAGHLTAHHNLKRLLLLFLPTWGWRRSAAWLEEQWEAAAEAEADQSAGPHSALDLASALLKVARLTPAGGALGLPVAALHAGEAIATRVQALLDSPVAQPGAHDWTWRQALPLFLVALPLFLLAVSLLPVVHRLSEALIHLP